MQVAIRMALLQKLPTKMSGCKDINGARQIIPIGMPMFCFASHRHHDYTETTIKKTDNVVEMANDIFKQ